MVRKSSSGRKKKSDQVSQNAANQVGAEVAVAVEVEEETAEVAVAAEPVKAKAALMANGFDDEDETIPAFVPKSKPTPSVLTLNLSSQLYGKIKHQAEEEGISVNEYVTELLAEGVVLRAWEIVERKAQMRGGAGNGNSHPNQNNHRNNNNRRNDRFNRRGGMSSNRYNNIMEDKASFLEYVRNQERQGR